MKQVFNDIVTQDSGGPRRLLFLSSYATPNRKCTLWVILNDKQKKKYLQNKRDVQKVLQPDLFLRDLVLKVHKFYAKRKYVT